MALIVFEDTLEEFANNLIADIRVEMAKEGLGSSNLSASLDYEVKGDRVTVTSAPYLKYAQKGRGGGGVPWNFTDILLDWMKRYNIHDKDGDDERFANAIKWKTIKDGSAIWRGVRPERDFVSEPIDENIEWLERQAIINIKQQFFDDRQRGL